MLSRHSLSILLGVSFGFLIAMTHGVLADKNDPASLPIEELSTFAEVFTQIKQGYVEEVDNKTLIEYAIKGMLSGLDPHSAYLVAEDYKELQVGTRGEFGGLGIEVNMKDGFVQVISPIDDTPAQRAGVLAGDLIVRLNQTPVKGMTLNDAVKIMRGKPGEALLLTISREGEDKLVKINVVRDIIKIKSVKSRLLEPGYAYIRISQFQSRTTEDLRTAITNLQTENKETLKGLVLDLRNNPGGVLTGAVGVSDTFITAGKIVYTEGRVADSRFTYSAKPHDMLNNAPLIVLVNAGSASASEIVAGALQDHKRAIIMGSKTFGKGSVQTIQPINGDSAIKLTTARYFTPNGRSIQAEGIVPDIILDRIKIASIEKVDKNELITEANLTGHLENPANDTKKDTTTEPTTNENTTEENDTDNDKNDKANKEAEKPFDYALHEALNLLKGISIMGIK